MYLATRNTTSPQPTGSVDPTDLALFATGIGVGAIGAIVWKLFFAKPKKKRRGCSRCAGPRLHRRLSK